MKLFGSAFFFLVLRAFHASASIVVDESLPPQLEVLVPGRDDERRLQTQRSLFWLFSGDRDIFLQDLEEAPVINLFQTGEKLNIMAHFRPEAGESCVFDFNGVENFKTERVVPYTLFGDLNAIDDFTTNFRSGRLPLGENTVTATVYSEDRGRGEALFNKTVTFTVIDEVVPTITGVSRISTPGGQVIYDICPSGFCSDQIFFETEEDLNSMSYVAYAKGPVESVKIVHGQAYPGTGFDSLTILHEIIENVSPYTVAGDMTGGDIYPYIFQVASSGLITFTPYSGPNGTGEAGEPFVINVIVSSCLFDPSDIYLSTPGDACESISAEFCAEFESISLICPGQCGLCD